MGREAVINRQTKETKINFELNLDGTGEYTIDTGVGFFDHMLTHIAKHGFFDMNVKCLGDLQIDAHHTIEDVGIVFGQVLSEALGNKEGIKRYGSSIIPMDETLIMCALDLSGRPYLNYDAELTVPKLGNMELEMVEEFFRAVSVHGGMNLHIKQLEGKNNHHIVEGIFKAFANALDMATTLDPRITGTRSTKGSLD